MKKILLIILTLSLWAVNVSAQRRLFVEELKKEYNGYVYDFIERYFNEIVRIDNPAQLDLKLRDDKVFFVKGTINDISKLTDSTDFSLTRFGDTYYEAQWLNSKEVFLKVAFPIQYELLLGKPKIQIEKEFESRVKVHSQSCEVDMLTFDNIEPYKENVYRTSGGNYYQIPTLNDCVYLMRNKDGKYSYLCDSDYIQESITNLFHFGSRIDCTLVVEQNVYGFQVKRYNMSLLQWLNYCHSNNMNIYAAIEEETTDSFKVLIVSQCLDLGFNHLLSATVPKTVFTDTIPAISVKLNAFIPTHNIKDLYQQYSAKNTKKF